MKCEGEKQERRRGGEEKEEKEKEKERRRKGVEGDEKRERRGGIIPSREQANSTEDGETEDPNENALMRRGKRGEGS